MEAGSATRYFFMKITKYFWKNINTFQRCTKYTSQHMFYGNHHSNLIPSVFKNINSKNSIYWNCSKIFSLGCARFVEIASELTKTWSSGFTEFGVWIGNCNVKVWKSTEDKLHKIWNSKFFLSNFSKTSTPLVGLSQNLKHNYLFCLWRGSVFRGTGVCLMGIYIKADAPEILSTGGRYASYWNAYLLYGVISQIWFFCIHTVLTLAPKYFPPWDLGNFILENKFKITVWRRVSFY